MIADEPIYSITSKITTTRKIIVFQVVIKKQQFIKILLYQLVRLVSSEKSTGPSGIWKNTGSGELQRRSIPILK